MSLTLSPEFSARVLARSAAASTTPEELLDEALTIWEAGELPPAADREELNRKIQEGLDQLDRGEAIPGEEVMAKAELLLARYLKS